MKIEKQYHTKINTTNVKSAYNVSTVTRSLSDTVKEAKLVLHSIEVKTETPELNNLKAEVLDAHTYRVTWQGKLDTELILLVNLTNSNQVLTAEDDFENMELTNSITLEPRDLIRMVENGELFLEAEYQRGFVWSHEHKEEFLLDWIKGKVIVTPYLVSYYQDDKHIYEVLDGKQRLQTVYEFLANKITVNGLLFEELLNYDKHKILHRNIFGLVLTQKYGDNAYERPDMKTLVNAFVNFNKGITVDEEVIKNAKKLIEE